MNHKYDIVNWNSVVTSKTDGDLGLWSMLEFGNYLMSRWFGGLERSQRDYGEKLCKFRVVKKFLGGVELWLGPLVFVDIKKKLTSVGNGERIRF